MLSFIVTILASAVIGISEGCDPFCQFMCNSTGRKKWCDCCSCCGSSAHEAKESVDLDGNNMDTEDNNKYVFIEFVGLNVITSILTTLLVIGMVYCICCRLRNKSSKGYGRIDHEVNVDHEEENDEIPIKENV